jgi:hypothetical protein
MDRHSAGADRPPGRPPCRISQEDRSAHHHAHDRGRVFLDRHATYIVAAYIAGAAR